MVFAPQIIRLSESSEELIGRDVLSQELNIRFRPHFITDDKKRIVHARALRQLFVLREYLDAALGWLNGKHEHIELGVKRIGESVHARHHVGD